MNGMDGSVKIGIDVDDERAKKNLKEIREEIEKVGSELTKTDQKKMTALADGMEKTSNEAGKLVSNIEEVNKSIEDIKSNISELTSDNALGDIMPESTLTFAEHYNSLLDEQKTKLSSLSDELLSINGIQNEQNSIAEQYLDKTSDIKDSFTGVSEEVGDTTETTKKLKGETDKISGSMNNAKNSASSMGASVSKGFKSIVKYSMALFGIRTIYAGLRKLSKDFFDSNDASAKQMQANLGALSSGLTQLIAPALKTIIGWLTLLMGYANAITKAFFGVELFSKKTAKNVGSGAGSAKKMRKEVEKMSASFDEAEVVSSQINDNLDSGGGGVGVNDLTEPKIPTPDISGFIKAVDKMKQKLDPFIQTMKSIDLQPLARSFEVLGGSIVNILGIIGNSLANMLNETVAPFIKLFTEEIAPLALLAIAGALDTIAPHLEWLLNEVVEPLFNWFMLDFLPPIFGLLIAGFELLTPVLDSFLEGVRIGIALVEPFAVLLGGILLIAVDLLTKAFKFLTDEISKEDSAIGDLIKVIGFILTIYAVFQTVSLAVGAVIGILTGIIGFLVSAFKFVMLIVQTVVAFFAGAFSGSILAITALVGLLILAIVGIATNFKQVLSDVRQIVGNVIGIFRGLMDFIVGVFTGDWKRAWKGVVDIFSNIIAGIANIFKFPINIIIDGMNAFIRGLNRIKIPSWVPGVGGKGINIGSIPRLAKGGVLNKATLNVAGEAGKEAVVPLENNTGWINDFIRLFNENGGNQNGTSEKQVIQVVLPNGKVLAEVVNNQNEQTGFNMNGGLAWST